MAADTPIRILFVTDEYPPYESGGYAQLCAEVAEGLRSHGHRVAVLCDEVQASTEGETSIFRWLQPPIRFGQSIPIPLQQILFFQGREQSNLRAVNRACDLIEPDVIFIWPNFSLDQRLMAYAEKKKEIVTAYYLAGFCPLQPSPLEGYWANPGFSKKARIFKSLLFPFLGKKNTRPSLELEHVMCVSHFEMERVTSLGVASENISIVYNGIDLKQFPFLGVPSTRRRIDKPLRVLYMGRLVGSKGAHTLLEATRFCKEAVKVTILGDGNQEYKNGLQKMLQDGYPRQVEFRAWVDREKVPSLMAEFDVLCLPTIHPEPLARTVQEAMARGLVVVATSTGGTPEIVIDNQTGLLFEAGNPGMLAQKLDKLATDLVLCDCLALSGRKCIEETFTIERTVNRIENLFTEWMSRDAITVG